MSEPVQEARRVLVTRTRRVDNLRRMRVDDMHLVAGDDHRALRRPGERRDLAVVAHLLQRVVERPTPSVPPVVRSPK